MVVVVAFFVVFSAFSGLVRVWCSGGLRVGGGGKRASDRNVKVVCVSVVCGDKIHDGLRGVRLVWVFQCGAVLVVLDGMTVLFEPSSENAGDFVVACEAVCSYGASGGVVSVRVQWGVACLVLVVVMAGVSGKS